MLIIQSPAKFQKNTMYLLGWATKVDIVIESWCNTTLTCRLHSPPRVNPTMNVTCFASGFLDGPWRDRGYGGPDVTLLILTPNLHFPCWLYNAFISLHTKRL